MKSWVLLRRDWVMDDMVMSIMKQVAIIITCQTGKRSIGALSLLLKCMLNRFTWFTFPWNAWQYAFYKNKPSVLDYYKVFSYAYPMLTCQNYLGPLHWQRLTKHCRFSVLINNYFIIIHGMLWLNRWPYRRWYYTLNDKCNWDIDH